MLNLYILSSFSSPFNNILRYTHPRALETTHSNGDGPRAGSRLRGVFSSRFGY